MTPNEINEILSITLYVASFATIIYACYVVIAIRKMARDDHRKYKRLLFADAMHSYRAGELDHIIPDGILNWSLEETKKFLKDNREAFKKELQRKNPNLKF